MLAGDSSLDKCDHIVPIVVSLTRLPSLVSVYEATSYHGDASDPQSITSTYIQFHTTCTAMALTLSHPPSVLTAPGPPQNLTLVNRTCHSITFQWSPPDDTGGMNVTGYDIVHNGKPEANITETVYTLEGLTPDTVHTISVRTRNAIGPSELEKTLTNATTQRNSGGWK